MIPPLVLLVLSCATVVIIIITNIYIYNVLTSGSAVGVYVHNCKHCKPLFIIRVVGNLWCTIIVLVCVGVNIKILCHCVI